MSQNPTTVFPPIIPDSEEEFVDDAYGERELERMDYDELRSIAADHPNEDVHGRMGQEELVDGLTGLERV